MSAFVLEDKQKRGNCKDRQSLGFDTYVQNTKRSLFHDVRVNYNLNKPKATGASDAPLKREYTLIQDNNAPIQGYWNEYFPCNAENLEWVRDFVNNLKRPQFYSYVRDYLAMHSEKAPIKQYGLGEDSEIIAKKVDGYLCPRCKCFYGLQFMDCAHIINWKDFLIAKGVRNENEARSEYNNLENLQLECRACNQSHQYENDFLGERTNILQQLYLRMEDFLEDNPQYRELNLYDELVNAIFGCPKPTASALVGYLTINFGIGEGGTQDLLYQMEDAIKEAFDALHYDYEKLRE